MATEKKKPSIEEPGSVAVSSSDTFLDQIREMEDRVMQRAYDLFVDNGSKHGRALEDWCAAEREVVWKPTILIKETAGRFEIRAAVAGIEAKDLHIEASTHDVLIKGEAQKDRAARNGNSHKNGLHLNEFHTASALFRAIPLPKKIDPGRVKAKLKDGLLTISAPIAQTKTHKTAATKDAAGLKS